MIRNRILEWAKSQPQSLALIEGEDATTYFEFARKIEAVRSHFATFDLPRGHFAFVFARTNSEHLILALALRSLGLNTVATANLEEATRLNLRDVACIALSEDAIGVARTKPAAMKDVRLIAIPKNIYARERVGEPPQPSSDSRPSGGYVLCTSGTTGTYKKLLGGGPTEEGVIQWYRQVTGYDRHTVYHMLDFPPWTGIGAVACTVWYAGGCLAFSGRADRFGDFYRHRPTRALLVPALLPGLLRARPPGLAPREDLELSVTGGFLPSRLAERIAQEITPRFDSYYGSTETCAFMRSRAGSLEDLFWLSPVGEIEVTGADGSVCGTGIEGEIRVRLMDFDTDHYMDDPEATAKFFRDGYFYPGDAAVRRDDGRIRVLGRIDDVLNLRGMKVTGAPLEERIQRALGVDCVCIFAQADRTGDEEVVIAVESLARPSGDVLAAAVKGIWGFEHVRWEFLEAFPRTQGGLVKVDRRKLRALIV